VNRRPIALAVLALAVSLGACASMPERMQSAVSRASALASPQSAQDRVHAAMDALQRGDERHAGSLLEAALREEPGNATARRLLDQINSDPRRQLGERSRSYTVLESDTMTSLAQRFVGDPLMFYALARYNNMAPDELRAGQQIQVPDRRRSTNASVRAQSPPAAPNAAPSAPPALVSVDASARAARLRLQGLERLNAGDADNAVVLLRQAHNLDAGNAAIQSDLRRAQRIQASLRAN
jgi:LysM domain